jgi:DNA-binding MarR family transcriptional regulator
MATDPGLGTRIKATHLALRTATDRALRDRGLTASQHAVLAAIGGGGVASNAELSARASIAPQSAHETLRLLEERGLVERPGPTGRGRASRIRLTRAGHRALIGADARVRALESRVVERLGEAEALRLDELLAAAAAAVAED